MCLRGSGPTPKGRSPSDYFILSVVGPDSVSGCHSGAHLTSLVDRTPVTETRTNSPKESGQLDLTVR